MRLKILLPSQILLDEEVKKITAEGRDGAFTLLPRHIDFLSILAPGLLSYETPSREEVFLAVDGGVLVKCGGQVQVSSQQAVRGGDLGQLRRTVPEEFVQRDEQEEQARVAISRLEAGFVRRFMELQDYGRS